MAIDTEEKMEKNSGIRLTRLSIRVMLFLNYQIDTDRFRALAKFPR
jgi:hypothetical protein